MGKLHPEGDPQRGLWLFKGPWEEGRSSHLGKAGPSHLGTVSTRGEIPTLRVTQIHNLETAEPHGKRRGFPLERSLSTKGKTGAWCGPGSCLSPTFCAHVLLCGRTWPLQLVTWLPREKTAFPF